MAKHINKKSADIKKNAMSECISRILSELILEHDKRNMEYRNRIQLNLMAKSATKNLMEGIRIVGPLEFKQMTGIDLKLNVRAGRKTLGKTSKKNRRLLSYSSEKAMDSNPNNNFINSYNNKEDEE